jgi:TetR/AcrR family transcriptional regulator
MRMPGTDRRRQLIETALDVFSRKGFDGATTKEIAVEAGVTEAIIFRHFPTKQALYTAAVHAKRDPAEIEAWMTSVKSFTARNDDAGLFREIARVILGCYRDDPRHERMMLYAALEGQQQTLVEHRRLSLPIMKMLTAYVARRQKEGALKPGPPKAVIAAIAGMASHYAMMTGLFGFETGVTDDAMVDAFVYILMDGVRARKSDRSRDRKGAEALKHTAISIKRPAKTATPKAGKPK